MDANIYLIRDNGLVGFITRIKESQVALRKQLVDPKTAEQFGMWRTRPEYIPGILRVLRLRLHKYKIKREPMWISADARKVLDIADRVVRGFKIHEFPCCGIGLPFPHIDDEYRKQLFDDLSPHAIALYVRELFFHPDHPEYHCMKFVENSEKIQVYQHFEWRSKNMKTFVMDIVLAMAFILQRDLGTLGTNDADLSAKLCELWDTSRWFYQATYSAIFDLLRDLRVSKNSAAHISDIAG